MRFLNVTLGVAALSLAMLSGCAGNKECCKDSAAMSGPKTEPAKNAAANMTVINTMCPIGGDDFEHKTDHPASLTRSVAGQNIGFCCDGCVKKFDSMSDDKKAAILTAAKENKVAK